MADLKLHEKLGVHAEQLDAAGVRRVTHDQARDDCGIRFSSPHLEGIWYPNLDPERGHERSGRIRRDQPGHAHDGRPIAKYVGPPERHYLYFPPGAGPLLGDRAVSIIFVEAEKSALALTAAATRASRRLLVIGTGGCWGWRGTTGKTTDARGARVDEKGPLPDLDRITWTSRDTIILFDSNVSTNPKVRAACRALAEELRARGAGVRFAVLPMDGGINGPDDFIAAHGEAALLAVIDGAGVSDPSSEPSTDARPPVPEDLIVLPNDQFSFSESARTVFKKLASTRRYFVRGTAILELVRGHDGLVSLSIVTPSAFRSRLDREAKSVMAFVSLRNGVLALRPKRCSQSNAEALIDTIEARELLPPIRLVTRSPVLVAGKNGPDVLGPGYHQTAGGVLITSSIAPSTVSSQEAVAALRKLLRDFDFVTRGDESRALAAMITPVLTMGGWLRQRAPLDVAEADQSQAGKTIRQRLTRSMYNERAYLVAQRDGGVGSLDESLSEALLSGRPFIALDNMRGRLDSRFLEAALTWSDTIPARVPHRAEVHVDATAVTFQLSSNGMEATQDCMNRATIVRSRKRPHNYTFYSWPEGGLIAHVDANVGYYLGCVFAVVRSWVEAGCPRLPLAATGFHDFREWAGVLGWIVEKVFGAAPLLEGHQAAQARAANPALSWLRALCLAADRDGQLDVELRATGLAELSEQAGLDLPGGRGPLTEELARQMVGKLLARCFRTSEDPSRIAIDDFEVHKTATIEYNAQRRHDMTVYRYRLVRPVRPDHPTAEKMPQIESPTDLMAHRAQEAVHSEDDHGELFP